MTNITLNLPQQFRIRPTIPFSFFDCETGAPKKLIVGDYHYNVINDDNKYRIEWIDGIFSDIWLQGFISEEDLIDGIIKGKLVIV